MHDKLLRAYSPKETEERIYKLWEESGFFNPDNLPGDRKEPFTIIMPPPNVTGGLHMGQASMLTVQDIMIRYKRMQGFKTLWLPGTDHAAIATQAKAEKEENLNRKELGREKFLEKVNEFAERNKSRIRAGIKIMGASCDWSRETFTLDDGPSRAVRIVFKKMYDEKIIYRGHRIVNWDPKGQTTISDDEVEYVEEKTKFYYLKYGPFTIGTARPETKFGDKYIVLHPDDKRYKEYKHGQKIELEWINGPITATVIKDECVDMEFGTGAMTITPWHSVIDFDLAEKHKLDKEQIIDQYGKLLPIAQEFGGMKINEARLKIVDKLKQKGLWVKEEDYTHNVATAQRTGGIIEPQIKLQWFIDVNKPIPNHNNKTLKQLMREPIENGEIKIIPDYFNKTYFHWINNLRDWCISRQIWYGHRIPVWYKGNEEYCGEKPPEGEEWAQDEDTLDTWFSSALWTFSTLGWPDHDEMKKRGFDIYHPTDVLNTGYDILFFWVARMILMTEYTLGTIPFKIVYLNGMIRTEKGQKMSKSLGKDNIEPLEVAEKYGIDAGRMSLILGTAPGTDKKISWDKIKGYKNFSNKVWNATRFVLENTKELDLAKEPQYDEEDAKSAGELQVFISEITIEMDEYKFYLVAEKLYHYFWHTFADIIIERSKKKIIKGEATGENTDSTKALLMNHLETLLKALHPFMPFVTEEIWSMMPAKNKEDKKLLLVEEWPAP